MLYVSCTCIEVIITLSHDTTSKSRVDVIVMSTHDITNMLREGVIMLTRDVHNIYIMCDVFIMSAHNT